MGLSTSSVTALLSAWVYRSDYASSAPPGFTALNIAPSGGLAAAAYKYNATNQIFVVARGTDNLADGVVDSGMVSSNSTGLMSIATGLLNLHPLVKDVTSFGSAQ